MYHYVIVGGGSAGCVLANRLSENPFTRVLLLEAGGRGRRREIAVPAAFSRLFGTTVDWGYRTEPQRELAGRRLYWPRGKVLGGSSAINAMIYVRGNPLDYDAWRSAGNAGWSWADVLPYFKRAEDRDGRASAHHGRGGPLRVADPRTVSPVTRAFLDAGAELGYPRNPDFNAGVQDGFGLFQLTQRDGRRESAATAYIEPARRRPNLTVLTGAHATRVLFERGRATGVEYVRDGRTAVVAADFEVIVCAGAANSPQLLLLSGVGPAEELERHGIPVVQDLPGVGAGLHDHLAVGVAYECTRPVTWDTADSLLPLLRYLLTRRGPLASNVAEAGAFVRSRPELPAPDIELLFGAAYYIDHGRTRPPGHGFTLGPTLLTPRSRGRITLRSADPFAPPAIDPAYLSEPEDVEPLAWGIALARRLAGTWPFEPFRGREVLPGPAVRTDDQLRDYVRERAETLYHPAGTCRMGTDELAVVDASLRVRGVERLRVVDASVMPAPVRGNTNAPVIMIAEKAADVISTGRGEGGGGGVTAGE